MTVKKKIVFLSAFVIAVTAIFVFTMSFVQAVPPKANLVPSDYDPGMTYNQAVMAKKPMAVLFYVNWCHYCQKFAPVYDGLRKQYAGKMNFVMVNHDLPANKKLGDEYMISGYPSLYLVNPKNDNRVFLQQSIYERKDLLKREFDRFLRVNK